MLHHWVLFALDGFDSLEQKKQHLLLCKESLEALVSQIPELVDMKVHINQNPAESYDFALEAIVGSMENLAIYAGHPKHQTIVQESIKPYLKSRACVDFWDK